MSAFDFFIMAAYIYTAPYVGRTTGLALAAIYVASAIVTKLITH